MQKKDITALALIGVAAAAVLAYIVQQSMPAPTPPRSPIAEGPAEVVPLAGPKPTWAFAMLPSVPIPPPIPEDAQIRRIPGSSQALTLGNTKDRFNPPDWWPDDHPAMPPIVATGQAPEVFACSYCHLPNGFGRPENASLAGKPVEYMVHHMNAFRDGTRTGMRMPAIARLVSDADAREAAVYFNKLQPTAWVEVIESDTAPRTKAVGGLLVADKPQVLEPIGHRIIEVAKDIERTELRDARSPFVAYVPRGSVTRGRAIVASVLDETKACSTCHGPDLRGAGLIPGIAGRSPSYTVRELYDMQSGARHNLEAEPMKPIVANMRIDDMIAVAAYLGTLKP